MDQVSDKLLVLDLDETLIYSELVSEITETRADQFHIRVGRDLLRVSKRPNLDEFLTWCFHNYVVAVWSASDRAYVETVLAMVLPRGAKPIFVWCSNKCTTKFIPGNFDDNNTFVIKDLKKINKKLRGPGKNKVLIVDDTSITYVRNYGNAVPIAHFRGSAKDNELARVRELLSKLKDHKDVRSVEKRPENPHYLEHL